MALPLGYHDVQATVGAASRRNPLHRDSRARLERHPPGRGRRAAGVAVSLYGVRSERNWGCGDFRDLLGVIDWVADDLEASFVGLNPLHAIHNRRPFNTSPYLPNCIFYQNFLYLDVEGMEDFAGSARAARLRASPGGAGRNRRAARSPVRRIRSAWPRSSCDFSSCCSRSFCANGAPARARAREFDAFREREGDLLEQFAPYCALDEWLHRREPEPVDLARLARRNIAIPDSAATARSRGNTGARVMFYQYLQWQIDLQLRRAQQRARDRQLSIGLYHDLALATDRFGSDLWAHRPFFVAGCRVGSPPDDFAPEGPGLGLSAAQRRSATARTATACSPNPSARTAATAARCAWIT